jgi:hypothetical protein
MQKHKWLNALPGHVWTLVFAAGTLAFLPCLYMSENSAHREVWIGVGLIGWAISFLVGVVTVPQVLLAAFRDFFGGRK